MSLRKHKRGAGTLVTLRRVQKRNKRRLLEAPAESWKKWNFFAEVEGLNWSEFTRRALLMRCSSIEDLIRWARDPERTDDERASMLERLPGLAAEMSEKPPSQKATPAAKKKRAAAARGKGSSRS